MIRAFGAQRVPNSTVGLKRGQSNEVAETSAFPNRVWERGVIERTREVALFDRNALGQIPRLIDIATELNREMIGEQL